MWYNKIKNANDDRTHQRDPDNDDQGRSFHHRSGEPDRLGHFLIFAAQTDLGCVGGFNRTKGAEEMTNRKHILIARLYRQCRGNDVTVDDLMRDYDRAELSIVMSDAGLRWSTGATDREMAEILQRHLAEVLK
jgi:hypothetical protein